MEAASCNLAAHVCLGRNQTFAGEDDGYIVAYAHHLKSDTSYLVIFRATDMKLQAKVLIPQRIPMGFHGQWINASQLKAQMA